MLSHKPFLEHPSGKNIKLPKVIPSFSSKGFPFFKEKKTGRILSEISNALAITGQILQDSVLFSAYDIHYGFIDVLDLFNIERELIIIDSGGYELSNQFDSTEPKNEYYSPNQNYTLDSYKDVLSELKSEYPIAIANFDYNSAGKSIEAQISEALALFKSFPGFLHDFIVKPVGKARFINMESIIQNIKKMKQFHIIGVTENELGSSLLDRMISIAHLRMVLNSKSIDIPIHIWGGLDPVITPLYFIAGADIFDGVSWLRYGFYNDTSIPRGAFTSLELGIRLPWGQAEAMRLVKNACYLETLGKRMRRFNAEGGCNFELFGVHNESIQRAYKALCRRIPEIKGDLE